VSIHAPHDQRRKDSVRANAFGQFIQPLFDKGLSGVGQRFRQFCEGNMEILVGRFRCRDRIRFVSVLFDDEHFSTPPAEVGGVAAHEPEPAFESELVLDAVFLAEVAPFARRMKSEKLFNPLPCLLKSRERSRCWRRFVLVETIVSSQFPAWWTP
jgi:hypothetical protein